MTEEEKNRQDPEVAFYCERPEIKRKYTGLTYADKTEFEKIDIYLPDEGEGPFPVIIDVHGGGWFYGSRSSKRLDPVLEGLHRGYAVASVDYTLSRYEKFPLQVQELKAAVRFLRKNADQYLLDPDKMAFWGLSAGAHLAMLAALSAESSMLDDEKISDISVSCKVQALVALYGPVDLGCFEDTNEQSMESILLGVLPKSDLNKVREANPCTYVTSDAPPCFLQYGDADELVPLENGKKIINKLREVRPSTDYFEVVKGAGHADPLFRTEENNKKIFRFLDSILK